MQEMKEPLSEIRESEDAQHDDGGSGGHLLRDISNEMVGLFKQQFGRGPTKVRSNFADPDTLVCVLENTLTPAEKNMVKLGEHQRLRDVRLFFQHASEAEFRSTIERLVGRPVRAYTSAIDTRADLCVEVFVFEPEGGDRRPAG
jgi:uncharacterized protein YbcI